MNRDSMHKFMGSQAGKLFITAALMFAVFLAGLGAAFFSDRLLARTLAGVFLANAFGGRAAGVGLCIAFQMGLPETIAFNLFVEVVVVLFSYSLFLFSMNYYIKSRFVNKALLKVEKNALKYQDKIARYGWIGVFTFVMLPLPGTGPVAGSIIAYFLNFTFARNFVCVISGTLTAIVLWTVFFDFLSQHVSAIHVVIGLVIAVAVLSLMKFARDWYVSRRSLDR